MGKLKRNFIVKKACWAMVSLAAIIKSLFINVHKNSIAIDVNLCYNYNILKNKEKFPKPERYLS
nr:MAG TPA: hypothetical protein [Caudoviricetes sp.]